MNRVRLGYFEGFKSSNTLLFEGDADGLRELAAVFRSLAEKPHHVLELNGLPFVEIHHGVELTAMCGARDRGIRCGDAPHIFLWERTSLGWQDAAQKLDVLSRRQEGHHYLDADKDELVVQVSTGEYGDLWWLEHG